MLTSLGYVQGQDASFDYDRSLSYAQRTSGLVYRDHVEPHWIGTEDAAFWYRVKIGSSSYRYKLADCVRATVGPAFDHQRLADLLSERTGQSVSAADLHLNGLTFTADLSSCRFRFAGKAWQLTLDDRAESGQLRLVDRQELTDASSGLVPQPRIRRSRNGSRSTEIRFHNHLDEPLELQWVTTDGEFRSYGKLAAGEQRAQHTYAGHAWVLRDADGEPIAAFIAKEDHAVAIIDQNTPKPAPMRDRRAKGAGRSEFESPDGRWQVRLVDSNVILVGPSGDRDRQLTDDGTEGDGYTGRVWWSPDSQHVVVMKTIRGQHREIMMIDSAPDDSIHPKLITIPYAKPGDVLDRDRPVLFSLAHQWEPHPVDNRSFDNPFDLRDLQWREDSSSFSFLYNQRGHQCLRLISVDAQTAESRVVIDETSDTFVCYSSKSFLYRNDATNEAIWMSERSGWNHLYLIDTATGQVRNPITKGHWVVRGVERVDPEKRQIELRVSGIDPDQDPYYVHLVRVDWDGGDPVRLTSGLGDHRWMFSPSRRYLIDVWSRVDMPPVTVLRNAETGQLICELERADMTDLLESGWLPPEPFVAKGRDGTTDIYGIIVRPTNFDPQRRYPVVEHIYAGPHSAFVPKRFGLHRGLYEMAELGFIVVKIDGMGTNHRSKSFHDICWRNLGDSGFDDRVAWMKSTANTHPEMNLERVGIWGGSAGGQSAMRALITHGDFYDVAVADCGCHDNRVDKIWWNEQWMGWPIGPHYAAQSNVTGAHRIKGDLMLIWGELDRNVDPASTVQVIDALVRANVDFEQLLMPGVGHGAAGHPYAKRRQAEFLFRKLYSPD